MKKALFIISLKYPLINAINIKINELKDKKADIILDGYKNDYIDLSKRLQKTGAFDNVFLANPEGFEGLKNFCKNFDSSRSFSEAVNGTIKNIDLEMSFRWDKESFINKCIVNDLRIDLRDYDELYICSESKVTLCCTDLLVSNKQISEIHLIEEGSRDYCENRVIIQRVERYKGIQVLVHLYDPDVIAYDNNGYDIKYQNIKKIRLDDIRLINMLNYVFDYDGSEESFHNKIIFFEQVAEPMPLYLENSGRLLRLLLHNAYKKHLKEDNFFQEKNMVINYLVDTVKSRELDDRFFIKLHPRTIRGILPEYIDYVMGDKVNTHSIPWEVYCINENFEHNVWITIFSSSIVNRILCFERQANIKYIILNMCEELKYGDIASNGFYKNVQKKYGDILLLPKSIRELNKILQI